MKLLVFLGEFNRFIEDSEVFFVLKRYFLLIRSSLRSNNLENQQQN